MNFRQKAHSVCLTMPWMGEQKMRAEEKRAQELTMEMQVKMEGKGPGAENTTMHRKTANGGTSAENLWGSK